MTNTQEELYPFYSANIHERRFAARMFRTVPLGVFLATLALVLGSVIWDHYVLLVFCAINNVSLWLWIVATCIIGIVGSIFVDNELMARSKQKLKDQAIRDKQASFDETGEHGTGTGGSDSVVHLIVLPNYKEEEAMLSETLESLAEAQDSRSFRIVLAMEERESGGVQKGDRLKAIHGKRFAQFEHTHHPSDLTQSHNDDSVDDEVPGKAPNVKWAVKQAHDWLQKEGVVISNVILTVADADCIFHPDYFVTLTKDFNAMREYPGDQQKWTMWQAPQLSYRDHWRAIICARSWTYVSGMYEFGGVSGLYFGGHHMVFSGYSLTLELATNAQSWDGDIIAEDHHAYIKNFFYSAYESAKLSLEDTSWSSACRPMLQVKPVFLPVKSTPVIAEDGYWQNYVDRWHQASRHTQGVAEISYALLCTWDMLCVLPLRLWSFNLFAGITKVITRLFCMHLLPIVQGVALAVLTLFWLWNGREIAMCPNYLSFTDLSKSEYILCGLAGAWVLTWPVVVPMGLLIVTNMCFAYFVFMKPAQVKGNDSIWHKEDGGFPEGTNYSKTTAGLALILVDSIVGVMPMMIPYGLLVMLISSWNCCLRGNRFTYVTAAKPTKQPSYGAVV